MSDKNPIAFLIILLIGVVFLTDSCASPKSVPEVIQSPSPDFPTPSTEPSTVLTNDSIVHPTPQMPPYEDLLVAFTRTTEDTALLIFADMAGNVLENIDLGDPVKIPVLKDAISPDGKHFAYCSGSDVYTLDGLSYGLSNLVLRILDIHEQRTIQEIPLTPENFPENFLGPAAELLQGYFSTLAEEPSLERNTEILHQTFVEHSCSLSWSPDGRYLAYSGISENGSSDIHLYNTETNEQQVIASKAGVAKEINWSPNGELLAYSVDIGDWDHGYIILPDGTVLVERQNIGSLPLEWISPTQFLFSRYMSSFGAYDLNLIDAEKKDVINLWPLSWWSYAYDRNIDRFLLFYEPPIGFEDVDEFSELLPGIYEIDTSTGESRFFSDLYADTDMKYWRSTDTNFVTSSYQDGVNTISESGDINKIAGSRPRLSVSPNHKFLATYESGRGGLKIYSESGELVEKITSETVDWMMWSQDSCCILYSTEVPTDSYPTHNIYSLDVATLTSTLVGVEVDTYKRRWEIQATWMNIE